MDVELRFTKADFETKACVMKEFGVSENDFNEIRSLDGNAIVLATFIAVEILIKNPEIFDKLLKREGCEVVFDKQGRLLKAKGYSASDILKLMAENSGNESK